MAKRKNPYKSKKTPSSFLFIFLTGVILILLASTIKLSQLRSLSYAGNLPTVGVQTNEATPERITIKNADIDLVVGQTYIINKNWQIFDTGASHLITSANPGEKGNIIVYGHNTLDRFGRLSEVKRGDVISVNTNDGKTHTYKVTSIQTVSSNNVKPLSLTNHEVLTLYTCTGFADLKRLIIQATPTS